MIDNRDCKKCTYYLSDECISCTPEDSNFEPKEKKMKVMIKEFYDRCKSWYFSAVMKDAKKRGWIKQSNTARQEFEKLYDHLTYTRNFIDIYYLKKFHDLAIMAMDEEAEKK